MVLGNLDFPLGKIKYGMVEISRLQELVDVAQEHTRTCKCANSKLILFNTTDSVDCKVKVQCSKQCRYYLFEHSEARRPRDEWHGSAPRGSGKDIAERLNATCLCTPDVELRAMNNLFRGFGAGRVGTGHSGNEMGKKVEMAVAAVDEELTLELMKTATGESVAADGAGSSRAGNNARHYSTTIKQDDGPILTSVELPHTLTGHTGGLEPLSFEEGMFNLKYKHRKITLDVCADGCHSLTSAREREAKKAGTTKYGCKSVPQLRAFCVKKIKEGVLILPDEFHTVKKTKVVDKVHGDITSTKNVITPLSFYYHRVSGKDMPKLDEDVHKLLADRVTPMMRMLDIQTQLGQATNADWEKHMTTDTPLMIELQELWASYRGRGTSDMIGKCSADMTRIDHTRPMHRSLVAVGTSSKGLSGDQLRPLLKAALTANPRAAADNFEKSADWWHACKREEESWINHAHQLLPVSGPGRKANNKGIRGEVVNILKRHAKPHLRRCSTRGAEVWKENSAPVTSHLKEMSMPTSAYWQQNELAATIISKFLRWRCCGRYFGGTVVSTLKTVPQVRVGAMCVEKATKRDFAGFSSTAYASRHGIADDTATTGAVEAGITELYKRLECFRLPCLRQLTKLRRLVDARRKAASLSVRSAWEVEFHKHMGAPGRAPDHSMCPENACCRNANFARMYKWTPVPSQTLDPLTMGFVKQCMNLPSTLSLLDKLASGSATSKVENFHSLRCHFATKQTSFKRWGMRNTMAKMHYNENLGRAVKYEYESKQRRLGKTVMKKTLENATYRWQEKVIEQALSC